MCEPLRSTSRNAVCLVRREARLAATSLGMVLRTAEGLAVGLRRLAVDFAGPLGGSHLAVVTLGG
jgi:hypothetical protein